MENYERLEEIGKGNSLTVLIFLLRELWVGIQDQEKSGQPDSCMEGTRLRPHD
jgi:hypothetical protein